MDYKVVFDSKGLFVRCRLRWGDVTKTCFLIDLIRTDLDEVPVSGE
jgi:hypothetical protein